MDIDQLIDQINSLIDIPLLTEKQERILIEAVISLLLSLLSKQKEQKKD